MFSGSKNCIVPFRLKESELALLDDEAELHQVTRAEIIRRALEDYLFHPSRGQLSKSNGNGRHRTAPKSTGRHSSGSKTTPSGVKMKVKAASSRAPKKSISRTQPSH